MQHYMRHTMRLLLVLSAFLTAMVGLGAVPAAARPASEISASAVAKSERQAPRIAVISPLEFGALDHFNFGLRHVQAVPARAVPLYAERLRI